MQNYFSGVALLVLAFTGCRSAPSGGAEVHELLERQQSAWNAGDVERFLRIGYWNSPDLVFFSGGDVVRGFDTMLARFLARYASNGAERGELTFADVEVVPLGAGHALARGHWFVDFAQQEDQGGLFSLVLERRPEGWRIVHDHTSVGAASARKVQ